MSTLMQWTEQGQIRKMSEDGSKPVGDCTKVDGIRFLAGSGVTDAGGQWQMTVADAVCEQVGLVQAVSFVATTTFDPRIDALIPPSVITTAHTASGGYVTLYARTWDCACELRPHTPFDYHVAIAYVFVQ
jgi:hypothetical protein